MVLPTFWSGPPHAHDLQHARQFSVEQNDELRAQETLIYHLEQWALATQGSGWRSKERSIQIMPHHQRRIHHRYHQRMQHQQLKISSWGMWNQVYLPEVPVCMDLGHPYYYLTCHLVGLAPTKINTAEPQYPRKNTIFWLGTKGNILFYPTDDVNWYHCTGNEQRVEYSIYLFTFSSLLGIRNKISYTLETMLSQIPKIFYFMCHFRFRVLSAIDRLSIRILYNYTHILWFIRDLYLFIYILIISYILKSCYIQIWISIYHLFHLLD